jgi:hypothetical protein
MSYLAAVFLAGQRSDRPSGSPGYRRRVDHVCATTGQHVWGYLATVIFCHRLTLHSARLLDVANRLDPTVQSTLSSYSGLIVRNAGAGSNPALGALQLFRANIITQSRLLSYIDIYLGLAVLSGVAVVLLAVGRLKPSTNLMYWHLWYTISTCIRVTTVCCWRLPPLRSQLSDRFRVLEERHNQRARKPAPRKQRTSNTPLRKANLRIRR